MKKLILILALVVGLADTALAESWLCIPEAAAGVTWEPPLDSFIGSDIQRYLLKRDDESEKFIFSFFGELYDLGMSCQESSKAISCTNQQSGFTEFVMRKENKVFHYVGVRSDGVSAPNLIVSTGKCDQI